MEALTLVALVPLAAAIGLWAVQRPARLVGIYAAIMPFGSTFALPLGLPRSFTTVSSIVGGAATLSLAWDLARRRLNGPPVTVATALWLLMLGLAAARTAWSIRPAATIDDIYVLGSLVAFYLLVAIYPFTKRDLWFIADGIVVGSALTGAYATLLALTSNLPQTGAGVARFEITGAGGGEGGDPNITAAALLLGFSVALHSAFRSDVPARQRLSYLAAAALTGSTS